MSPTLPNPRSRRCNAALARFATVVYAGLSWVLCGGLAAFFVSSCAGFSASGTPESRISATIGFWSAAVGAALAERGRRCCITCRRRLFADEAFDSPRRRGTVAGVSLLCLTAPWFLLSVSLIIAVSRQWHFEEDLIRLVSSSAVAREAELFLQLTANALVGASVVFLVAVGFALVYYTTRFFHFAHGAVFAIGAYTMFACKVHLRLPMILSVLCALCCGIAVGVGMEMTAYRPLRKRSATSLALLLVALGLYIVMQNIISLAFGDDAKSLEMGSEADAVSLCGARLTVIQISTVGIGILAAAATSLLLRATRVGRAMRAVGCDPELAETCGVNANRAILAAFAVGSLLAAAAGVLVAMDVDMTPNMGLHALLLGVVAVIVARAGRIGSLVLASLLVGLSLHVGVWKINSQWQDIIVFSVLVVFLVFRSRSRGARVMAP